MLEMENERLDFTGQLGPEDGYELDACVGTTYSLDMEALLGACMALAGGVFRGGSLKGNPIGAFASVLKLSGKIAIFCEKGRIKNADRTGQLVTLLEPLINQVVVRRPRNASVSMASFHPKIWLLKFSRKTDGSPRYRLLVTSRNLTFSGAWDVAARLDGYQTDSCVPESAGIVRFLEYLRTDDGVEGNRQTHRLLKQLSEEMSTVRFEVDSAYFEDYDFLPFGPVESGLLDASSAPLFTETHTKTVVMSPFLGNNGPLKRLAENRVGSGSRDGFYLLSREIELAKIDGDLLSKYTCYTPKDWLSDVSLESDSGDAPNAADYSDLHAKLYMTERYADRNLYLGSLNASHNGMTNNVEALLKLGMKKRRLSVDSLIESLVGEERPFGPYKAGLETPFLPGQSEEAVTRRIFLDRCFHAAAKLLDFKRVEASSTEERLVVDYALPLFVGFDPSLKLTLSPYLARCEQIALVSPGGKAVLEGVPAGSESEFFILQGASMPDDYQAECLIRCPDSAFCCNLSRDERIRTTLEKIMDTAPGSLTSYVALAFGLSVPNPDPTLSRSAASHGQTSISYVFSGIYESLLRNLAIAPNALKQLDYAKLMLSFLPSKFDDDQLKAMRDMVAQFEKAVRRHG